MQTHLTYTLICLALSWTTFSKALAQTDTNPFEGIWAVSSETSEPLILILKPSGEASYFNIRNNDLKVYQGHWSTLEGIATAR